MEIRAKFRLKSNILSWSDQNYDTDLSGGGKIEINISHTICDVTIVNETDDAAREYLYLVWELLALYDGYFYEPVSYVVDEVKQDTTTLFITKMYHTDSKWVESALMIGRNKRCFSEEIISNYKKIRGADRKSNSMDRSMLFSFFYILSNAYREINIEHRLVLLMHICDGFALAHLNGNSKNNSGNINIIVRQLESDAEKYKHGAGLLGISANKALNALGETRNELTHYICRTGSLGSYISNPNTDTDNMANLYAFYVLELSFRISLLQTIGFQIEDEIKEYLLNENLDWIRLKKHIEEDCVIPHNAMIQILQKLQDKAMMNE